MIFVIGSVGLAGAICGLLGPLLSIRKLSLFSDLLGHSVLPGVALGLSIGALNLMSPWLFALGLASALCSAAVFEWIQKDRRTRPDAALTLTLSGFYSIGVLLLVELSKSGRASGLNGLLLGQGVLLQQTDFVFFSLALLIIAFTLRLFWRRILWSLFDPAHARLNGVHSSAWSALVTVLAALGTLIALKCVGAVLASALFLIPAACTAGLFTKLHHRLWASCMLGGVGAALGAWVSGLGIHWPLGATTVLVSAAALVTIRWTLKVMLRSV
jgi:manganese/zinc/iron transport system permease protein